MTGEILVWADHDNIFLIFCDSGHKHKMRCARQGVAPNKTILTPASSTAPSTTPSEASAPVRSVNELTKSSTKKLTVPIAGPTQFWSEDLNLDPDQIYTRPLPRPGAEVIEGHRALVLVRSHLREADLLASPASVSRELLLQGKIQFSFVPDKMSKVRKFVRPRLKTEPGSRVSRSVKLGGGAETGRGVSVAADSTTESDDAGTRTSSLLARLENTT